MAINITFVDFQTPVPADWLNHVNSRVNVDELITDFGPTNANTVQSAVSTVQGQGGGILRFPNGNSNPRYDESMDTHLVLLEYDGPNVPVSQGGEPAGTNFFTQKLYHYQDNNPHPNFSHSVLGIESRPIGSGGIGAAGADFCFNVSLLKQNWFDQGSAHAGEVDGINIIVRNGGNNSDTTGFLINVGNAGIGFNCLFEGTTSAGGKLMDVQCGVVDTRSGLEYGIVLAAFTGQLNTGILIQADGVDGAWTDFIQCIQLGVMNFRLDATGVIHMRDASSSNSPATISFHVGNGTMGWTNNNGTSIMTLDQSGDLNTAGSITSNTAITVGSVAFTGATVGSATAGGAALPSNPVGFITATIGGTVRHIPYYN